MRRALIFLVLGPLLASATVGVVIVVQMAGAPVREYAGSLAVVLFFLALPVASLAASFDAYLERAFAIPLRAPLIAAIGAIVASGLAYLVLGCLVSPSSLKLFAIGGATCMGTVRCLRTITAATAPRCGQTACCGTKRRIRRASAADPDRAQQIVYLPATHSSAVKPP